MRIPRTTRLLVTGAVCSALAAGTTGIAAASGSAQAPAARSVRAPAPLPGAQDLVEQSRALGGLGEVLTPVGDFLDDVLSAEKGALRADSVSRHAAAVGAALDKAEKALPRPARKAAFTPTTPRFRNSDNRPPAAPRDLRAAALNDLRTSVDALVKAAGTGGPDALASQVRATITAAVNVVQSTLQSRALPAADLPGLAKLPKPPRKPGAGERPRSPAAPTLLPAVPESAGR